MFDLFQKQAIALRSLTLTRPLQGQRGWDIILRGQDAHVPSIFSRTMGSQSV